jgi:hypothetical protein
MSKKLLEEQAVRKFMKIAGLQPLTNSFLKESEDQKESEEAKKKESEEAKKKEMEEGYGKKEEAAKKDGEKLEEEVEDLEEARSGFVSDREDDERATERVVGEAKELSSKKPSKMKGAPASQKMKPLKEEEMPEEGSEDVEAPEMDAAPKGDMGAGGLDVEGLVKELIRVITDKVPGAAEIISVEDEGEGTEVEMEPEMEPEMGAEDEEEALDEAALEAIVAETVKRVKGRLMESKKPTLTKQDLVKKVAAKVAEKLKKT